MLPDRNESPTKSCSATRVGVLSILIGFTSGRNMLELPSLLTVILVAALALFAGNILAGSPRVPVIQIWSAGILLSALSGIIALLPAADYLQDRGLRALALGLNVNIAYPVAAVALGFWLMHRFSNVTPGWMSRSIYTIAGMLTLAGAMLTVPTFDLLGAPNWVDTVGSVALIVVPILYLIFAAHSYRALSDRNATYTLAAHWYALSLLLFLLGIGLVGTLQAAPDVRQWTSGTRLSDLQTTLTLFAGVAMSLGILNQGAAEIRGQNRRVTGLMPFWLVAFGVMGSGLALGLAGVVQTFLERQLSVGYLDTQTLIIPLYTGWFLGLVLLALGVILYTLIFWLRRPRTTQVLP